MTKKVIDTNFLKNAIKSLPNENLAKNGIK